MVLKPDQERVKTLLQDTITLLCRNGLNYKCEFNINALIGITLDKDEVFLVDIRETIKNSLSKDVDSGEENGESEMLESPNTPSQKRRKHRRKRSHSMASDGESMGEASDSLTGTPAKGFDNSRVKPEDSDDDAIIIKDEPGYESNHSFNQTPQGDILGSLAQQGQLFAAPTTETLNTWDQSNLYNTPPMSLSSQGSTPGAASSAMSSPLQQQGQFECRQCGHLFRYRSNLTKHERKHSGIFQYYCPYCGKGMSASGNLRNHLRKYHTGVEGLRCIYCSSDFPRYLEFRQHVPECANRNKPAGEKGSGSDQLVDNSARQTS